MTPVKEWIKVSRGPNGPAMVTVTLVDGNLTTKSTVKMLGDLKASVTEARAQANAWLDELREIVA